MNKTNNPVIHFASRQDAHEHVHMGPAICGAGKAVRGREDDQYVAGDWANVTCRNCQRWLKGHNAREAAEEREHLARTRPHGMAIERLEREHLAREEARCSREEAEARAAARCFTVTPDLQARAEREGWGIFNDAEVQRLDDDDANRGYVLADDQAAVTLARAAGVPVLDDGTLDCDELRYAKAVPPPVTSIESQVYIDGGQSALRAYRKHRPAGHPDPCEACETTETVYAVSLSVVVTMSGAPTCHTKSAVFEHVVAWLQTLSEQDSGDDAIDEIKIIETHHA